MTTIDVSAVEVLALKKLALISHALAMSLTDKRAAREQLALTSVVTDIVKRAESSPGAADE
jgi:hypothetical protein